jgi:thiamine-monophosphate kinase
MLVSDYRRYLDGLVDAADEWNCPVLGGNIKDGPEFTSTGTAFGTVPKESIMRRKGARPGDRVCVVGHMGLFWAAVLQQMSTAEIAVSDSAGAAMRRALELPVARLREGRILAESGLVTACMDSSDGVAGCLTELALKNGLDVIIDGAALVPDPAVSEVASALSIDPRKLMLSWGNWELVLTVSPESADSIQRLADKHQFPLSFIGTTREGTGSVLLATGESLHQVTNFASERFTGTSYFTHGLRSYMELLIDAPLTEKKSRGKE